MNEINQLNVNLDDYKDWKRLHILTILYGFLTQLPYMAVWIYFAVARESSLDWFNLIIFLLIGLLVVPGAILNYFYFTYKIDSENVYINSGVLSKTKRKIPIIKIQNISLEQNVLHRILGVAKVKLETAGESGQEAALSYIKTSEAEKIKQYLSILKGQVETESNTDSTITFEITDQLGNTETITKQKEDLETIKLSIPQLMLYGALRFRPIMFALIIWGYSMFNQWSGMLGIDQDEIINEAIDGVDKSDFQDTELIVSRIVLFLAFGIIASWVMDIVLTTIAFYGYTLKISNNKLVVDFGLLVKRHFTSPFQKIQGAKITFNPIRRKFDNFSMSFFNAGLRIGDAGSRYFSLPASSWDLMNRVADKVLGINASNEFQNLSNYYKRKRYFRIGILFILSLLISLYFDDNFYTFYSVAAITPLLVIKTILGYKNYHYSISQSAMVIKKGIWFKSKSIIPIKKIQNLKIKQTLIQRRLGTCSFELLTAAQNDTLSSIIPDINLDTATSLKKYVMENFHSLKVKEFI